MHELATAQVRDIVICDLDGTLALDDHRHHFLEHTPRKWKEYFELCHLDEPNHAVVQLVRILNAARKKIYILTGRSEDVKEKTVAWLHQHGIVYEHLEMRRTDSRTDDHMLKLQWVEALGIGCRVWAVLEDRDRVVKAWRTAGYSCLQVREGNF